VGATVVLNVTATDATRDGYVTIWSCDSALPTASALTVRAGATVANMAIVTEGSADICLFTLGGAHLIADLLGYWGGLVLGVTPTRVLDTRVAAGPLGYAGPRPDAGQVVAFTLPTLVPTIASAVALDVTVTEASAPGYLTIWPCERSRPPTSTANFSPGEPVSNLALIATGSLDRRVCVYFHAGTHVIVDVVGYELKAEI
jgi:hypothetical protein